MALVPIRRLFAHSQRRAVNNGQFPNRREASSPARMDGDGGVNEDRQVHAPPPDTAQRPHGCRQSGHAPPRRWASDRSMMLPTARIAPFGVECAACAIHGSNQPAFHCAQCTRRDGSRQRTRWAILPHAFRRAGKHAGVTETRGDRGGPPCLERGSPRLRDHPPSRPRPLTPGLSSGAITVPAVVSGSRSRWHGRQ